MNILFVQIQKVIIKLKIYNTILRVWKYIFGHFKREF